MAISAVGPVVATSKELLKLSGLATLTPTLVELTQVFKSIGEKQARLEGEALQFLSGVISSAPSQIGPALKNLNDVFKEADGRHVEHLVHVLVQVAALDLPDDAKREILLHTTDMAKENQKAQNDTIGWLVKILVASGGAAAVIVATLASWGRVRPKTLNDNISRVLDAMGIGK